jgi:deazaflavin-dependent oxidoreductase (nitroreductase family)
MGTWLRALLSIGAVAAAATAFVKLVFVHEAARKQLFPVLRPLYRHVFNPKALRDAARGETRWGVIHHVGRRSGTTYATPIDAQRTVDGVVICLVYGPGADWCRNVLAAGHCTITLDREELTLDTPRVISLSEADPKLSQDRAHFWRNIGIEHCLLLQFVPAAQLGSEISARIVPLSPSRGAQVEP